MKRFFFHKEVILKRGYPINSFLIITAGTANVLNSSGNIIIQKLNEGEVYGLVDNFKEKKWKNTVVSEKNSEVIFISKDFLMKNIFASKKFASLATSILKMAS